MNTNTMFATVECVNIVYGNLSDEVLLQDEEERNSEAYRIVIDRRNKLFDLLRKHLYLHGQYELEDGEIFD